MIEKWQAEKERIKNLITKLICKTIVGFQYVFWRVENESSFHCLSLVIIKVHITTILSVQESVYIRLWTGSITLSPALFHAMPSSPTCPGDFWGLNHGQHRFLGVFFLTGVGGGVEEGGGFSCCRCCSRMMVVVEDCGFLLWKEIREKNKCNQWLFDKKNKTGISLILTSLHHWTKFCD